MPTTVDGKHEPLKTCPESHLAAFPKTEDTEAYETTPLADYVVGEGPMFPVKEVTDTEMMSFLESKMVSIAYHPGKFFEDKRIAPGSHFLYAASVSLLLRDGSTYRGQNLREVVGRAIKEKGLDSPELTEAVQRLEGVSL